MPTLSKSPKMKVADMLANDWDESNTRGIRPKISSGWWDKSSSYPQVTVNSISENAVQAGDTGYISINNGDGAPTQLMGGELSVQCWAQRGNDIGDNNPKTMAFLFSSEVKRIVRANFDADDELNEIGFSGREQIVDTEPSPVVYRFECSVLYSYIEDS